VSAEATQDVSELPRHVAVICDGNGRWARARRLSRRRGHEAGARAVRVLTEICSLLGGIGQLTFYGLSYDNRVKRPRTEVAALYRILRKFLRSERPAIIKNNIRFRVVGETGDFPRYLQDEIARSTDVSRDNTGMVMCLALNYSGRREIAHASRELAQLTATGALSPDDITTEHVAEHLFTAGMPDVDLLIRSGGEVRVSDFLLWQISYAEIYVTDVLWPDFGEDALHDALRWYAKRHRRFGAVKES